MSDPEIETWKSKYTNYGLPTTMLDEMIAEAEAEWISELQYSPYDRYAILTVKVQDDELLEGEFYVYLVQRAEEIFRGIGTFETEMLFNQIPTVEIVVTVYKLLYDGNLTVKGFGWGMMNLTKDDEITITVEPIEIILGYGNVEQAISMTRTFELGIGTITTKTSYMTSAYEIEVT